MALPNVIFNQSPNGLGRPLTGQDHVSGYIHYYTGTLPSGFTVNDRIKKVLSVADAVALGITNTSLGETKSTGTYLVTTSGASGNIFKLTGNTIEGDKLGVPEVLCNFTLTTADVTTPTTAASAIASAINAGTNTHGFTATSSVATVTWTAKPGEGIFLNTGTPYVVTITGTIAGTLTQNVVVGTTSFIDIAYYHISEYFRVQPKGELYVAFYAEETTYAFADITTVQNFSQGAIRQFGLYEKNAVFITGQLTALQAVQTANDLVYKPFVACLGAEISGTASVATLTDVTILNAPTIAVTIAQDGFAKGYHLYKATGKSIGTVGALLGSMSFAAVNESIAWPSKFNMALTELDTIAFANGQKYTSLSDSLFESLNNYGYIFLRKLVDATGSFWSDSHTAVTASSDYSTIENNRTYQKITRNVRAALLPALSSSIKVNADGTLSSAVIGYFEALANAPLTQMEAANEISAHKVIINPAQNVLATSTIELTLQNVPLGIARIIKVNVGFVKSV